jgi:hypothetical protein
MGILCRNITVNLSGDSTSSLNNGGSGTVSSFGNQVLDMSGNWGWKGEGGRTLSSYDSIFKATAKRLGLDWRLVAAQAFVESKMNPYAKNPSSSALSMWQIIQRYWPTSVCQPTTDPKQSTLAYESIMRTHLNECKNAKTDNDRIAMALQKYHDGSSTTGNEWAKRKPGKYGRTQEAIQYVPKIIRKYREYCR